MARTVEDVVGAWDVTDDVGGCYVLELNQKLQQSPEGFLRS